MKTETGYVRASEGPIDLVYLADAAIHVAAHRQSVWAFAAAEA